MDEMARSGPFAGLTLDGAGWAAIVLVATRLVEGGNWLWGALTKPPWRDFGWFGGWVDKEIRYAEIGAYKWFLVEVVRPNLTFFGWVQFLTEAFLAAALILGLFVGATGLLAAVWAANIAIGSYPIPGEFEFYLAFSVLVPLLLAVTRSGRIVGLDARLRPRLLAHPSARVRSFASWAT